ncbi:ATP-binding protein [candidate division NPL-UPA2 bacterium]|nr:ATP-binding protein [candidate division NPL-UPA2 bacterium]
MNKTNSKQVFWVVAAATIASNILAYPLGNALHFSVASAIFMYAILSLPALLIIPTGSFLALSTFVSGTLLDYFFKFPELPLEVIAQNRLPGILYFIVLAIILKAGGIKRFAGLPFSLNLAGLMIVADLTAKVAELILQGEFLSLLAPENLLILLLSSFIQVFLVFSFINIGQFKQLQTIDEQTRLRFEKNLIITSNLYDDFFFMQKSAENLEGIMADSYKLYKKIKSCPENNAANKELEEQALQIAEQVHEVKKDSFRILAGLAKTLNFRKKVKVMCLSEILELVIKVNRNYSQKVNKQIHFHLEAAEDMMIKRVRILLAVLNNIVENAVEAIPEKGNIHLLVKLDAATLRLEISDDGKKIPVSDVRLIFEPGYTTKFNVTGIPSTGIGLAYVKGLLEDLGGKAWLELKENKKHFILVFPREKIEE